MRKTLLLIFTLFTLIVYSQEEKDTTTYSFSVQQKVLLEIIKIDSVNLKYHVLDIQPIDFKIDYSKTDTLFSKNPVPNTIEFFFAEGIDQDGPFKTVLIIRNNSEYMIDYKAAIAENRNRGFYMTSTHPLFPGVISSELWNDSLEAIVPHALKISK